RDFLDVAFVDLGGEFAIAGSVLARGLPVGGNQAPEHDPQEYDGNPKENRFSRGTGIHFTLAVNPEPGKDSKTLEAPLAPLLGRPPRLATPLRSTAYHQVFAVATGTVRGGQPVAGPQLFRCSLKAKVIRLQSHMPPRWLVQQHGQAQGPRLALTDAPQQKILSDAAFNHGIHQQDIAALKFGAFLAGGHGLAIGEENFAAGAATLVNVPHIFTDKVHDHGRFDGANEIRGKDEGAVHGHHHVQPASVAATRDLPAEGSDAIRDPRGTIGSEARLGHDAWSSVITTPSRVSFPAANSWEAPSPRTHAICPPVVSTGHNCFSQRLTPISLSRRASLWRFRWPRGCMQSPGTQLRSTRGTHNRPRSKTAPVILVSRPSGGQSITLRRRRQGGSTIDNSAWPARKSTS